MVELFANKGDPDQTPRSVASDLGLDCLPITLLGVYSQQRVNSSKLSHEQFKAFFFFFFFFASVTYPTSRLVAK